jgi:hypothetical protein
MKMEHTHSSETLEYFQPNALRYISNFGLNKRANLKFRLNTFILLKLSGGKTFEKKEHVCSGGGGEFEYAYKL